MAEQYLALVWRSKEVPSARLAAIKAQGVTATAGCNKTAHGLQKRTTATNRREDVRCEEAR